MAEAVVSMTVETLRYLLMQEPSFLSQVKGEVQGMQKELQAMQCFLKDADHRQSNDERVRNWVRSIRDLAYKIENVLETYAIKVESRKGKGIKKTLKRYACLLDKAMNLHKLGEEIRNIRDEIANLTTRLQTYGIKVENIGECSNAESRNLLRQNFAHEMEEHFVGMEDDVHKLVSLMTDRDKDARIISIFGMGGSGKTTLAKQVFNHMDVQNHFESFAWVVISQQLNEDRLLKEILRKLRNNTDDIDKMEYRELVEEVYKAQTEKKCLVVLDDIWKTEHWEILRHAFPSTSKVVFTTRTEEVAQIGMLHKLNLFNEDEGWQLLKRKALTTASAREHEKEYETIGKLMVDKCGYLPLAISVIGGILRKKETLQEWEMVNKDIGSYLTYGEGIEGNPQLMHILNLSYEDLPYQLKQCFLYLACYPEDANVNVVDIRCMWIAEGMVLSKDQRGDETLMEVAQRYLTELVSRSLVQVQLDMSSIEYYRYPPCHLHDLMRDLCLRRCKEEDFFNVMEFQDGKQVSVLNSIGGNAYRLAIYGEADDNVYNKILQDANPGARAYSLNNLKYPLISINGVLKYLRNLRFLKVIAFEGLDFSEEKILNKVIKYLIHLRYLSFIYCKLDEVPSSIAMLPYLQSFALDHLIVNKIPNVIWKLKTLMFLLLGDVSSYNSMEKLRLDGLSGLERLYANNLSLIEVKDLSKLNNLRAFRSTVSENENLSLIISCIDENWCEVKDISLTIAGGCEFMSTAGCTLMRKLFMCRAVQQLAIMSVPIRELPKYESGMLALSNLIELKLSGCFILGDPMSMLEKLPKLKGLWLEPDSFVGEEFICSTTGFPNLRFLRLSNLPNLEQWTIHKGAMPNLSEVSIDYCSRLEMIPNGMKYLKVLNKLKIERMPEEFNNRIRTVNGQEGTDFHKVNHVPIISIVHEND